MKSYEIMKSWWWIRWRYAILCHYAMPSWLPDPKDWFPSMVSGRSLRIIMGKAAACCEIHGLWRSALGLLKETPAVEEFACGFRFFKSLYLPIFGGMLHLEFFQLGQKIDVQILLGIPSRRWLTSSWRSIKSSPAPCFPCPGRQRIAVEDGGWKWSICLCLGDFLPHCVLSQRSII